MLLAGDLGGTKTLLGLYERAPHRPRPLVVREFSTLAYPGLGTMIEEFLRSERVQRDRIQATTVGVAGPVLHQEVELTNVPWRIVARDVAEATGLSPFVLLNDVEAMAYSVEALEPSERIDLQSGRRNPAGNGALLSIGTGVGMAVLHRVSGRLLPVSSEGGHADFAARTEREIDLVRFLREEFGRVEIERVVAGPGLANVARFTHNGACPFLTDIPLGGAPAHITRQALGGTCPACAEAMELFVEALGAVAGNLALTAKATGGLFIGGGVPGKILPALRSPRFIHAFGDKAPVETLVQSIPITVVTTGEAGLLGAAVYASELEA
jgi:glucokinase